jgi:hypothetical protein
MSQRTNDSCPRIATPTKAIVLIAGVVVMVWSEVKFYTLQEGQWNGPAVELMRLYNATSTRSGKSLSELTSVEQQQLVKKFAEAEQERTARVMRKLYALVWLEAAGLCLSTTVVGHTLLVCPAVGANQEAPGGDLFSAQKVAETEPRFRAITGSPLGAMSESNLDS